MLDSPREMMRASEPPHWRDNGGAARYVLNVGAAHAACSISCHRGGRGRGCAERRASRIHAVLPGQADHHRGRLHHRRHLRRDRAAVRAPSWQAPRRQSQRGRAQYAGLRQPGRDAAPLQRRAQGRHDARRDRRRRRARAAARQCAGDLRRAPLQLDRRAHQGQHRLRHLEQGAGAHHGRRHPARNRRRRDRAGLADADPSARLQRAARHQIQDRVRLSRRQRDHARGRARRGRRLLRLDASAAS